MRIGINGFGRIGRVVARILFQRHINVVHINDPSGNSSLVADALRNDSVYVGVDAAVTVARGSGVVVTSPLVNWRTLVTSAQEAAALDWQCDAIIDASNAPGKSASWRTRTGTQRVILAGHDPDADCTIVLGASTMTTIGNLWAASTCDAVAIAPLLNQIDQRAGVTKVFATIVHPALSYQRILDLWPPAQAAQNAALSRSVLNNIIPHETSVSTALRAVLPSLADRVSAMSFRVPTDSVCMAAAIIVCREEIELTTLINGMRGAGALISLHDFVAVSRDFVGDPHSVIVITPLTEQIDRHTLRVVFAYDNEWGYASRLADLLAL
jgi:glyceraldehyde 3-phosphate dehydrogenase